jgi:hypothetical protein
LPGRSGRLLLIVFTAAVFKLLTSEDAVETVLDTAFDTELYTDDAADDTQLLALDTLLVMELQPHA